MSEPWLSWSEAVEMVRRRLNASIGRAEATVIKAYESGEVRACGSWVDDDFDERTGYIETFGQMGYSESDLAEWLDRQGQSRSAKRPERGHRYRHAGDAALVERGREMMASGMTKSEVARRLAPEAKGGNLDQRMNRLRKLLGGDGTAKHRQS